MKNFNEWLSFRSNSYQENENPESGLAFDIEGMPTTSSIPSSVKTATERFEKSVQGKFKNRQQRLIGIVSALESIYDFTKLSNLSLLRNELRTILNHIERNDDFVNFNPVKEKDDEIESPMPSKLSKPSLVDKPEMV